MNGQPANWYPDPDGGGGSRYWDGTQWTDQRSPAPPAAPTPAKKGRGRGCLTAIGAVVVVLVVIGIIAAIAGGSKSSKPGTVSNGLTAGGSASAASEVHITACANDGLGDVSIKGTAVNGTSKRSDYLIELEVTNKTGKTQLDSTTAIANNVDPGQTAQWNTLSTAHFAPGIVCKVSSVTRTASL